MKKLIHRYLDANLKIVRGNICLNNRSTIDSSILVSQLETIFDLDRKGQKWYIKSWIKKQHKGFDFNSWWIPKQIQWGDIMFPMIRRMSASTIANDLVSVQPMRAPSGMLQHFDYRMGGDPANLDNEGHVFAPYIPMTRETAFIDGDFVPTSGLTSRYSSVQVNPRYYGELDHGTPIGISSRRVRDGDEEYNTRREQIMLRRWQDSGILDGIRGHLSDNLVNLLQAQQRQIIN